jgi:hypothetical protein
MGDGNFRLVREMNGKYDPEDVALTDGKAYFSDHALYKSYLDKVGVSEEASVSVAAVYPE